jgi:hypothetical protein
MWEKTMKQAIAADSIWIDGQPPHGPDEIVASWKGCFDAKTSPFSWRQVEDHLRSRPSSS